MTNTCYNNFRNNRNEVSVMSKIITLIINFLNKINKLIWKIIIFLSRFIKIDDPSNTNDIANIKYRRFKVDDTPPIIEPFIKIEHKDYKQLIKDNNITPVKRRNEKDITIDIKCPCCGAPKEYLYDNNGKGYQFLCKVCKFTFTKDYTPPKDKDVILKCPHCECTLEHKHERSDFDVYTCNNKKCSYYLKQLNSLSKKDKNLYKSKPWAFTLHYTYRKYNITIPELSKDYRDFIGSPVDLSKIYSSDYVVGLCLTYHVNYGLSYRQTAAILNDIHEVRISYKTVENYCKAISPLVAPILEYYPYQLTDQNAADETYIKINGKTHYIFFFFDAIKKIITSYRVFAKRDSLSAIQASYSTLTKYNNIPDSLTFITDGNPIYNVAHEFWRQQGISFSLKQVIGLKNIDETSKEYRSQKQIIERLNRTLKYYYKPKGGFGSLEDANNYMVLFATCFNFLRPHSSLDYHTPVEIPEIKDLPNMPAKWLKLIELSAKYIVD